MKLLITALIITGLLCVSCGPSNDNSITVMAASSLRVVAEELSDSYEQDTGVSVRFNLAGSQALAAQILGGASSNLFISANRRAVEDAGPRAAQPRPLLANELVILVPTGNPLRIEDLADLAERGLVVVIADQSVPIGSYTNIALDTLGVTLSPASLEPSVSSVATRVATGDADAGVGYATDASANPALEAVALGGNLRVEAEYFAATIDASPEGEQFLEWLREGKGTDILAKAGFIA